MKTAMIAAAAFLTLSVSAFAQSNATVQGDATTSGNGQGMPSGAARAGQIGSTGAMSASPPAVSAIRTPGMAPPQPTADSKVLGTTTTPK